MSKITFEVSTFADAVKKADTISPTRGHAFDKAAGVVLEFDPTGLPMSVLRSTNLDIFRKEWIDVVGMEGERTVWRLPKIFGQIVASLPIGSGKQVTLEEKAGQVHLSAGRTKAKFNLLDPDYYPDWDTFEPDDMYPAKDLGGRIAQVEWAVSKDTVPITGVHLDGEYAMATDRYRLAAVPLEIPDLQRPVTVPAGFLGQMLKQTGDVQIGIEGNFFNIMPDEYTQIRCITFAEQFPSMSGLFGMEFSHEVQINRLPLIEIIRRCQTFAGNADRVGEAIKVFFGKEKIALVMTNDEVGQLGDVLDTPGYCDHDRIELRFTPRFLLDALEKAPNDQVTIQYNTGKGRMVHFDGGSGYRAWVAIRSATDRGDGS